MEALIRGLDLPGAGLAFALTTLALLFLQPVAARFKLVDCPDDWRKAHARPTPVTGGIAILVACLAVFYGHQHATPALNALVAGALLLTVVGIYDDLRDLRWYWRILAQVLASLLMIYWGGVRVEQIGPVFGLGEMSLGWLSVPFTVFATVGLINAVNMIDGADGLGGGLVLAALVMLTAASLYAGNTLLAGRLSVLCGALAAFLLWNVRLPWRPQAKVFLGNAGSAVLGLVIAWVAFRLTQNPGHPVNPVLALWLLPIPVIDCLVLIVRRLQEGRSPFSAGRDHIHHFMQEAGFGPTSAAMWLIAFSLLCGLLVGQAMRLDVPHPVLLVAFLLLCAGWYWLTRVPARAIRLFRRLRGKQKDGSPVRRAARVPPR